MGYAVVLVACLFTPLYYSPSEGGLLWPARARYLSWYSPQLIGPPPAQVRLLL